MRPVFVHPSLMTCYQCNAVSMTSISVCAGLYVLYLWNYMPAVEGRLRRMS